MNNSRYQKYYSRIVDIMSQETFDNLTESEVNELFSELLKCLPNNGKLYKYRNFLNSNHAFDNTYNSLREGYIWIADAKTMNDRVDVTLNVDLTKEKSRLEKLLRDNNEQILLRSLDSLLRKSKIKCSISVKQFKEIMKCFTASGRAVSKRIKTLLLENGGAHKQVDAAVQIITAQVERFLREFEPKMQQLVEDFISTAYISRERLKLFCVAEKPTIESMWAYYGNNSNGFCIEYDLGKAANCDRYTKMVLLNLFKVQYSKQKPPFSLVDMAEELIVYGTISGEHKIELNKRFLKQMLIKNSDWRHEQEWRILVDLPKNKFNVDLVGSIYIDESMINTPKGQKLIRLARKRGWKIVERKLSVTKSSFVFREH